MDDTSKPNLLPYGISSNAPAISLPDTDLFKSERGANAGQFFEDKLRQLNDEYDRLVLLAKQTDIAVSYTHLTLPTKRIV